MLQFAQLGTIDWKDSLLMQLLDCGYNDIDTIKDCNYDIRDIVKNLFDEGIRPTLNNIIAEIFAEARWELETEWNNKMDYIYFNIQCKQASDEDVRTLKILEQLDPKEDVDWDVNAMCSMLQLDNWELYHEVLGDEIDEIENDCGFHFHNSNN